MNYAILWLDALLIAILWAAVLLACVSRLRRKWIRVLLSILVVLAPLSLLGLFVFAAAMMKFVLVIEPDLFVYAVSLLCASVIGFGVILRRATRRESGMKPAAATWRLMPLASVWLLAVVFGYMTLENMDLAVRAQCAILSVQLNSVYLATLPPIASEAQNAAPLYEKAFDQLADDREGEELINNPPTGNAAEFDPNEPATIAFLARHVGTIQLLHRAASMSACRFDSDLGVSDLEPITENYNPARNAANVLNLDAREEIARGHVSSAVDDAQAILGMSRHFGRRPLIVSALVGIAIGSLGDKTLELALPSVRTREELSGLHLDQLDSPGRMFQQSLRGEECWGVTLYANVFDSEKAISTGRINPQMATNVPFFDTGYRGAFARSFLFDVDNYTKLMASLQDAATQPFYKAKSQLSDSFELAQHGDLYTRSIAPALRRPLEMVATVEAQDACARTAVAMTLYRLDHGTLPSRLEELVPTYLEAIPIDPFTGHPLRLVIKDDESIIYSVGPDGIDDGGVEMSHGKGDIIFTLKPTLRPAAATQP